MQKNETLPLTALQEGAEGIVQEIRGGHSLISRLAGLGLVLNTKLRFVQASGGLVIVQVSGTRVALGAGEAAKIRVRQLPPSPPPREEEEAPPPESLLVALAGQPNVGKSTVFNILTGLSQHVGNWPGKTVEKKEGIYRDEGAILRIVDLPGTYSLTAFSEEERVARDFIIHERPDVICLLVNAAALERSLYLLTELLLLGPPVVVAVNMLDMAEQEGIRIDTDLLEKALGIPVIPMIATKNSGIKELVRKITALARGEVPYRPRLPRVSEDHGSLASELSDLVAEAVRPPYSLPWVTAKLMEGDAQISAMMEELLPPERWEKVKALLAAHEDSLHAVVCGRYDWIEGIARTAVLRFRMGQVVLTDRIDHLLTRPILGIPVLLTVLAFVFLLTYQIGFPLQRLLEELMAGLSGRVGEWLEGQPALLKGVVVEGMIGGAGAVLTFLPILLIFFAFLALLEDVGYMARAAFVMDRFMHLVGLHGKSFIPLCLGFGCNVPAILGGRIIESKRARLLTMMLTPFVPCTARLAVLTFVAAAVFQQRATFVVWALVSLNILVLGLVGMAAHRLFLEGEDAPFIMELPLYHRPNLKTIAAVVWARTVSFVRKAGTVIMAVSVAVWILSYLPDGRTDTSYLAFLGRFLEPLGRPLGLDWKMVTALLSSIVAKENAVATLGVLYGGGEEGLLAILPSVMGPPAALAFLTVMMLFVPCAATVAVMRREMTSRPWFFSSLGATLMISYLGGLAVHRLALWIGL